jgi:hypothetical protein
MPNSSCRLWSVRPTSYQLHLLNQLMPVTKEMKKTVSARLVECAIFNICTT